jgi:uncharacterized membrane protein YfcA
MIDPLYVASGFGVGLLVGMTGVGGGSLMTPLLILLFGVHPSTAVGTDLLYAAATKTGGSLVHGWSQSIHWPAVIRLASGSIPASVVTLLVLWQLELNGEAARSLVNLVLCFALILTATSLIFRKAIMDRYRRRMERLDASDDRPRDRDGRRGARACWSRFRRSAPARSASPRCCCSIRACRWRASSAPTSRTPCR